MDEKKLKELSETYPLNPSVPVKLPKPTFWPIFLAFSVIFFFWGFITSFIITLVGLLLIGITIFGWIMELKT